VDPRRLAKHLVDTAADKVDETLRSPTTAQRISDLENWLIKRRYEARMEEGDLRGIHVLVHRGYVDAAGTARVHLRVVEAPRLPDSGSSWPYWDVLNANLRRHAMLPFPGVRVRAHLGGASGENVTDNHGYAALTLTAEGLAAGWHEVQVETVPDREGLHEFTDTGRVLLPSPRSPHLVISDIDDTVLRTGLNEGLTAVRRTLLGNAHSRRAVPGMSSLFRGIERGVPDADGDPGPPTPFFYLSTGSWAFYEMLVQFLQLRGYPRGPLFLTDWGPSEKYLRRSGVAHKRKTLRRLHAAYPQLPLVLVGDSGQNDFDIYVDFARDHPGAVKWILIVGAGAGAEEKTAMQRKRVPHLRDEGIPILLADNALVAARDAAALGLCDDITVEEVETELGAIF
jgi:phosphatidate phosphatase APP1